eukprot:Lankesteria_metandrocarpae@DN5092_c0_g1_i2.p1
MAVTQKTSIVTATAAVEMYSHRGWGCSGVGGNSSVPENSIAAFEKAAAAGITGAEIDVWMTADKEVLVIHGCGPGGRGLLHETTAVTADAKDCCIQLHTVEELNRFNALTLTESWLSYKLREEDTLNQHSRRNKSCKDHHRDACRKYHNLPPDEKKHLKDYWMHNKKPCPLGSRVPTLGEVFRLFYGRLKFNVELKGTNPDIGLKVLEIAQPFEGIITRISSFCWVTPPAVMYSVKKSYSRKGSEWKSSTQSPLGVSSSDSSAMYDSSSSLRPHDDEDAEDRYNTPLSRQSLDDIKNASTTATTGVEEDCYQQPVADLLQPLVNNSQSVQLALLFEKGIPSAEVVRRCLNAYSAEWAHIPHVRPPWNAHMIIIRVEDYYIRFMERHEIRKWNR